MRRYQTDLEGARQRMTAGTGRRAPDAGTAVGTADGQGKEGSGDGVGSPGSRDRTATKAAGAPAATTVAAPMGRIRRTAAAYAVWYLRIVATLDLLGGLSASFSNTLHRHNQGEFFTPYLLTAGFSSA